MGAWVRYVGVDGFGGWCGWVSIWTCGCLSVGLWVGVDKGVGVGECARVRVGEFVCDYV